MLLFMYGTGTELSKSIPPPPPSKQLVPLNKLDLSSSVKKVKDRKKMKINTKSDEIVVNVSDDVEIIKIDSATNTIVPLPCSFCHSNIATTHICRHKVKNIS